MPLWKIKDEKLRMVENTKLVAEKKLEKNLEEWIATDPNILGEPLFLIGRQVQVKEVKDRLDLLALDAYGKAVVIEIKRGSIKDPIDMQALRYASYLSRWKFSDFEAVAKDYLGQSDVDFNFLEAYEQFCTDQLEDGEDIPTPNQDQRIILVGSQVRDKLGSVALWLREHKIDIKVIEVKVFKDEGALLIEPLTIIPTPVGKFGDVGGGVETGNKPWRDDGKSWHLEKRCNAPARAMLEELIPIIEQVPELEGPNWSQKAYISYQLHGVMCCYITTFPKMLVINIRVKKGTVSAEIAAKKLGIDVFQAEGTIGDKMALSSSIGVYEKTTKDLVKIRCKEGFEFSDAFIKFLKECISTT